MKMMWKGLICKIGILNNINFIILFYNLLGERMGLIILIVYLNLLILHRSFALMTQIFSEFQNYWTAAKCPLQWWHKIQQKYWQSIWDLIGTKYCKVGDIWQDIRHSKSKDLIHFTVKSFPIFFAIWNWHLGKDKVSKWSLGKQTSSDWFFD